mgnify:CR=1 FL=1
MCTLLCCVLPKDLQEMITHGSASEGEEVTEEDFLKILSANF